jgi:hypothetical protein
VGLGLEKEEADDEATKRQPRRSSVAFTMIILVSEEYHPSFGEVTAVPYHSVL